MPVATVNKNDSAVSGQDDVRFAGEVLSVEAVTVAVRPEPFAYHHLGAGVLPLDSGHIEAALLRGMNVHCYVLADCTRIRSTAFLLSISG